MLVLRFGYLVYILISKSKRKKIVQEFLPAARSHRHKRWFPARYARNQSRFPLEILSWDGAGVVLACQAACFLGETSPELRYVQSSPGNSRIMAGSVWPNGLVRGSA